MKRILLVVVAAATVAAASAAPTVASTQPIRLSFDKSLVAPGATEWQGTVGGDISGNLTTRLTDLRITGPIWHVRFDFVIDAGGRSFTIDLSGILNRETGAVVMNGTVVQGYLEGAQVHEQAQLVDPDPATLRFQGSIQVMPATAG
jgi:hypothetical protein